jgi:alkylhydroperoxidase/carboxymuconolactone decarboxylase family protein YurZ
MIPGGNDMPDFVEMARVDQIPPGSGAPWTDQFFAFGASIYKSGLFTPRFMELISIAFDASITHMYALGTRRHIKGALQAGATPKEIMTVLRLCVSMGVQACAQARCPHLRRGAGTRRRRQDHDHGRCME